MKLSFRFAGALFAAVATLETLCTLCGAALFNSIYPLFLRVGFNGFSFLVMAVLMLAALTITEYVVTCFYKLTKTLPVKFSGDQKQKHQQRKPVFSCCPALFTGNFCLLAVIQCLTWLASDSTHVTIDCPNLEHLYLRKIYFLISAAF